MTDENRARREADLRREVGALRRRLEAAEAAVAAGTGETSLNASHLAFLSALTGSFAPMASSAEVARVAAHQVRRYFDASRVNFSDVDPAQDAVTVFSSDYEAGAPDDRVTHRLTEYMSAPILEQLRAGRVVAVDDVTADPRTAAHAASYARWDIGSLVLAPYVSDGHWKFLVVVHKSTPYHWRRDEVSLLGEVAIRTHLRLERARAEEALRAAHDTFRHVVEHSPFGVYVVNADFRLVLVSAGAQKVFENVRPLIGRDFADVMRTIWGEPFASEAIGRFRHTLETGEAYRSPGMIERRSDIAAVESYDWKIERLTLPDGRHGVVCHFYDLSERQRYEAALREADRQKDEFLAMLAHELRNPLAPIRTSVGILRSHGFSDPLVARCRDVIERQTAHMARLLDDLLDISRLSRGRLTLQRVTVPLDDVLDAAVETSRPLIDRHGQQLQVANRAPGVLLDADVARLTQVFANLLNNAAKYSQPGGQITLTVDDDGDGVVVRVSDTGIGIAPDMLERVFDLFTQARDAQTHAPGGLGIGLSLARRLVELHGGTIAAWSAGEGHGSEFTVWLPAVAAATQGGDDPRAEETPGLLNRRVLIADDNADAADSLALLLGSLGCDVRTVYDGEAAVAESAAFRPAVVLLDVGMPGLNGYDACARIRREARGRDLVIAAITGWGQEEARQRSAAAGFDRHLTKPVDPDVIVRLIRDAGPTLEPPHG